MDRVLNWSSINFFFLLILNVYHSLCFDFVIFSSFKFLSILADGVMCFLLHVQREEKNLSHTPEVKIFLFFLSRLAHVHYFVSVTVFRKPSCICWLNPDNSMVYVLITFGLFQHITQQLAMQSAFQSCHKRGKCILEQNLGSNQIMRNECLNVGQIFIMSILKSVLIF